MDYKNSEIPKPIINKLDKTNFSDNYMKEIEYDALGDDDIKYYCPNRLILTYPQLDKYNTIDDIIPKNGDYFFLLYLFEPNSGHWTLVSNNNNRFEFFCSFGSSPATPLRWITKKERIQLKQNIPYLDNLLSRTKKAVIYNPFDYQNKKDLDTSTCGRHCINRALCIQKYNMPLSEYYNMMITLKNEYSQTFDELVSELIDKYN